MKNKPVIKRLKYPTWFKIVFYILTVLLPISLIMTEGYQSNSAKFKVTFSILVSLGILWSFLSRFILSGLEETINNRKAKLEHDYEIECGDSQKIKYIWFSNEQKLVTLHLIKILLWGTLGIVFLNELARGVIKIKSALSMIATFYIAAYTLKFAVIKYLKGGDENGEQE